MTKVKDILTDASKWTQCASARDKDQEDVNSKSPDARCWCLSGAIIKAYGDNPDGQRQAFEKVRTRLSGQPGSLTSIFSWNDHPDRTFDDIKTLTNELDI